MKQIVYIIYACIIIFGLGCKKDILITRIDGTLVGLTEGQPIEGADIFMYGSRINGILNGTSYTTTYSTKTDKNGKFSFKVRQEKGYDYKIFARKKDYFDEETTRGVQSYVYLRSFPGILKTKVKLYLHEPTYINLLAHNASNYSNELRISFNKLRNSKEAIGFNCSNNDILFTGIIIPANKYPSTEPSPIRLAKGTITTAADK